MKMHRAVLSLVFAVVLGLPVRAGSILLDYSPDATGAIIEPAGSVWSNISISQNFAENIIFNSNVLITGMDIYSIDSWATVGTAVLVRTWNDQSGLPDIGSVKGFASSISTVDTEGIMTAPVAPYGSYTRLHVDFGANSFSLSANTALWIGISGLQSEIGLLSLGGLNAPGNGEVYMFSDTSPAGVPTIGGMAMRIHGEQVPETSSVVVLLGLGLCGLIAIRRAIIR
jgi:hypothetical protein